MRVIVIGATGTIGQAVATALSARHEVVKVGHTGGESRVGLYGEYRRKSQWRGFGCKTVRLRQGYDMIIRFLMNHIKIHQRPK